MKQKISTDFLTSLGIAIIRVVKLSLGASIKKKIQNHSQET